MNDDFLKPLSQIEAGATVKFVSVDAGVGLKQRLAAMGLLPNVQITVVATGTAAE